MVMKRAQALGLIILLAAAPAVAAKGPRKLKPGFNLFSKEQDIQLGREFAAEIEKQVEVVGDRELTDYVNRIGRKLVEQPAADKYPYSFKVVHDQAINAFALPGGPMYIHTGLIAAAENEAQLAGVMAHEISHVALRHSTNQVSKANLIRLPAMLAGIVGEGSMLGQLAQLGIGVGAGSLLLKFSRNAERDADLLGTRLLAGAGYNPIEMARFFEKLEAETGRRSGVAEFFSSHPNPGNRVRAVEQEIQYLPRREYTTGSQAEFNRMRDAIKRLPPPKQKQPPAKAGGSIEEARPSGRLQPFRGREFEIAHPDNWKPSPEERSSAVTIVPQAGVHPTAGGGTSIGYGAIINTHTPQNRNTLEDATRELLEKIQRENQGMSAGPDRNVELRVDGYRALLNSFFSPSPWPNQREVDTVVTVLRPQGLFYIVLIAPESEMRAVQPVFQQMLKSIRFAN